MRVSWKKSICSILAGTMLCLTACGSEQKEELVAIQEPVVNLKAIVLGTEPEEGMEELYQELDALTIEELNCTLRFDFIPWGDERNQLNIATALGEYDFIPGGVFSDYRTLVSKNAFLDLNDYMYLVPELQKHYSTFQENALKQCEINGGLYGIPQFDVGIKDVNEGFFYREDLRREWGLEPITDLATMEAYLYRAKEDERYQGQPLITDNRIWQSLWIMITKGRYVEINSMQETPFVVVDADNPGQLLCRMDTPEFKEVLQYIRKWQQDGILAPNMLVASDNEGAQGKQLMMADKKPCETNVPLWSLPGNYLYDLWQEHPQWEYGFFHYALNNESWYIDSLADSSVISISAKTTHPDIAIKLLEKIHTDQRYYDLVKYGVDKIHYNVYNGKIDYSDIAVSNRFGWTPATDVLLNRDEVPINVDWYENVEVPSVEWIYEVGKNATIEPLAGFSFETAGLERVMKKMDAVRVQYYQPIMCGYQDNYEQALWEAADALKQAGFEEYFQNLQEQLTEFTKQ